MGFNKMTKRLLFFGPLKLGAYGFTDAYTDQGIAQLQMFLGHMRHNDKIAQLIYIFNWAFTITNGGVGQTISIFHCPVHEIHRIQLDNIGMEVY